MKRTRLYIDTSVFGAMYDHEFMVATKQFFQMIGDGSFRVFLSQLVITELERAPVEVRATVNMLPRDSVTILKVSKTAEKLAESYIEAGILSRLCLADATHIASATLAKAEVLVSWNFKHLVNYRRIQRYNAVNKAKGLSTIDIRSPLEMIEGGNEEVY